MINYNSRERAVLHPLCADMMEALARKIIIAAGLSLRAGKNLFSSCPRERENIKYLYVHARRRENLILLSLYT